MGWTHSPTFLKHNLSVCHVAINQPAIHFHTTRFKTKSDLTFTFLHNVPSCLSNALPHRTWRDVKRRECLHGDHFLEATPTTKCIWPLSCLSLHTFFPRVVFISNLILDLYSFPKPRCDDKKHCLSTVCTPRAAHIVPHVSRDTNK